jgi:hypothetical protein
MSIVTAAVAAAAVAATAAGRPAGAGAEAAARMSLPRAAHSATLLRDGRVLLVGGCDRPSCELSARSARAELFDPRSGLFGAGPALAEPRVGHGAALLPDGSVLVAGGWRGDGLTATTEIYDARRGRFVRGPSMSVARGGFTITPLGDGRLLVAGGETPTGATASAEIYDSSKRRFVRVGSMAAARTAHAAAPLARGRVLVVGGSSGRGRVLAAAEVFDAASGRFRRVGSLSVPRHKLAAAPLGPGRVLVVGGSDSSDSAGRYATAEIFDSSRARFAPAAAMHERRYKIADAVVALASGEVVVAGGGASAESFDGRRFRLAGRLGRAVAFATATCLGRGRILVAGGYDDTIVPRREVRLLRVAGAPACAR